MHSKIYKAKLIALHSSQQQQKTPAKTEKSQAIHAYFGMLQHIFQRNKHMIRQLKLSGTKIQSKNGQENAVNCRKKKTSELVRKSTKQEKQIAMEIEQLSRQKSLPNYGLMLTSLKSQRVQSRYVRDNVPRKDSNNFSQEQKIDFMPIGQASQRKIELLNKSLKEKDIRIENTPNRGVIMLNFSNENCQRPIFSQREQVHPARKQSSRINRRSVKVKTQNNEASTNYSSIRTTQNQNKQVNSAIKLAVSAHQVTPW